MRSLIRATVDVMAWLAAMVLVVASVWIYTWVLDSLALGLAVGLVVGLASAAMLLGVAVLLVEVPEEPAPLRNPAEHGER